MGQIIYKKMSLFVAPKGSYLVHACNAQGIWGSGIAKEFKTRFPKSFNEYNEFCREYPRDVGPTTGKCCITKEKVVCLITSNGFADTLDKVDNILSYTSLALLDLLNASKNKEFYSNKFNSGLFKVPWEDTKAILKSYVDMYDLTWTVCDPNLEEENETES